MEPFQQRAAERLAGGLPAHRHQPIDREHRRHAGAAHPGRAGAWCGGSTRRARAWKPWRSGWPAGEHRLPDARTDCSPAEHRSRCWPGAAAAKSRIAGRTSRPRPSWPASCFGRFDGDVLAGPLGRSGGALRRAGASGAARPHLRPRSTPSWPSCCWNRSPWPWRTICGCARWPRLREAAEADKRSLLDAAGTQDAGRHDRRRRVGPPRRSWSAWNWSPAPTRPC